MDAKRVRGSNIVLFWTSIGVRPARNHDGAGRGHRASELLMAALPIIAAVAGLAGAGISAFGSMEAGQAQAEAASYQAQVARNNAVIAQSNANQQIQAGEVQASNQSMATHNAVGTTKAGEAASGVDVNTGSFANVRAAEFEVRCT